MVKKKSKGIQRARSKWPLFIVAAVIVLAAVGALGTWWAFSREKGPHWVTVTPSGGRFSVTMPRRPKEDEINSLAGLQEVAQHQFALDGGKTGVSFVVQYTDLPSRPTTTKAPADILTQMRDMTVAQTGMKMTASKLLTLQGNPGMEFSFHHPESGNAVIRYYLVKGRLYYLYTGPDTGPKSRKDMRRFLDSFQLKD